MISHFKLGEPEELEPLARAVLAVATDARRAEPYTRKSGLGPMSPRAASGVAKVSIALAMLDQSRGRHEEAIGHLRLLLDDLRTGPVEDADSLAGEAGVAAAQSYFRLGRPDAARVLLAAVRDNDGAGQDAGVATVLLEDLDGLDAYRGKFQKSPEHRPRVEALLAHVPGARARAASALGWPEQELPLVLVGVADGPVSGTGPIIGAHTIADFRRPAFPPTTVVFSELLARGTYDPEALLAHEFVHAAMMLRLGLAHESLPDWVTEGLAQAFAGELNDAERLWLDRFVAPDPEAFAAPDFWDRHPLAFRNSDCRTPPSAEVGLAARLFETFADGQGGRRLVQAMAGGARFEAALLTVTGLAPEAYMEKARAHAVARLEVLRQQAAPAVLALGRAMREGAPALLVRAEEVLRTAPDPLARGFALYCRANAIETLEQHADALRAWEELCAVSAEQRTYAERARMGRARALLALGRVEEARRVLEELGRAAASSSTQRWVREQLAKLASGGSG
ncbi:MAG: hypothetical protein HZA53_04585, partial [Planctomycetes bacterium]|nr:hypothetical protein [Planctomycetota bacterium]